MATRGHIKNMQHGCNWGKLVISGILVIIVDTWPNCSVPKQARRGITQFWSIKVLSLCLILLENFFDENDRDLDLNWLNSFFILEMDSWFRIYCNDCILLFTIPSILVVVCSFPFFSVNVSKCWICVKVVHTLTHKYCC